MDAEFLYNPAGVGNHAHGATLTISAQGTVVASWYAHPGPEDYRDAQLVIARRLKGASSWEPTVPLLGKFDSSAGNPVLFVDEITDIVWLIFVLLKGTYWTDAVVHSAYSLDQGASWSQPRALGLPRGTMVRHPPVTVSKGKVLLPAYDEVSLRSTLLKREGPGWVETIRFRELAVIQPVLIRESVNRLTLFFRPTEDPEVVSRSHSSDGGSSWSEVIRTTLVCPLSGIAACSLPGKLVVFHNSEPGRSRFPLTASVSNDGGISWSRSIDIDACRHEVSYPSVLFAKDGLLHGVYTFNRRMIKYFCLHPKELV